LINLLTKSDRPYLTAEQIEVRIWAFVVVIVMIVFAGITSSMLYSVIFVVQPIKSMAPIDIAFTKMLNDIVLLIVGGIGGIMSKRAVSAAAHALETIPPTTTTAQPTTPAPLVAPVQSQSSMPNFNWMGYKNPDLDESWTPPPPPTTPPEHLEDDQDRVQLALARKEVG
jgi:hypothetical protein